MQLDGRVAVITGAGRGLGEAIARRLAGAGACVAILDLTAISGQRVSSQLPGSRAYEVDVTDLDTLKPPSRASARISVESTSWSTTLASPVTAR